MSKEEKKSIAKLAEAFRALPNGKKEYLIGFAEGVISISQKDKTEQKETAAET